MSQVQYRHQGPRTISVIPPLACFYVLVNTGQFHKLNVGEDFFLDAPKPHHHHPHTSNNVDLLINRCKKISTYRCLHLFFSIKQPFTTSGLEEEITEVNNTLLVMNSCVTRMFQYLTDACFWNPCSSRPSLPWHCAGLPKTAGGSLSWGSFLAGGATDLQL